MTFDPASREPSIHTLSDGRTVMRDPSYTDDVFLLPKEADPDCPRCHGLSHTTIPPCSGCGGTMGEGYQEIVPPDPQGQVEVEGVDLNDPEAVKEEAEAILTAGVVKPVIPPRPTPEGLMRAAGAVQRGVPVTAGYDDLDTVENARQLRRVLGHPR